MKTLIKSAMKKPFIPVMSVMLAIACILTASISHADMTFEITQITDNDYDDY